MQAANDVDFAVEVKFQSAVTAQYQTQGIVVEQDSGTYLQVELYGVRFSDEAVCLPNSEWGGSCKNS